MTGIIHAFIGRFSTGFWRSKKQCAWMLGLLVGVFFIYVQFFPSDEPDGLQDSHQRLLSSYSNLESNKADNSYSKNVKFLAIEGDREDFQNYQPPSLESKLAPPPSKSSLQERQDSAFDVIKNQVVDRNALVVDAAGWSDGMTYKYNTFGEPVYVHQNRPNYVPKQRVVHFDLKGAPPMISAFKSLIPWLAQHGATSVLLEYEDMFPWQGTLAPLRAKNHYSRTDVKQLVDLCREHKLDIIPLVQTFGHLEFVLKHEAFSSLREVSDIPAAICPSRNDSLWLVHTMIDQMMELHKGVSYLHIGCDEVFTMGECDKCRLRTRENIFLSHVSSVASYVKSKYNVNVIIWHDMLPHISETGMKEYKFGELLEPMVWVYAEDVYRFVPQGTWSKFAQVFPSVWAASAFKGAFKEQATVPNVRRHLDNNLNWLDVMAAEGPKFRNGFKGLVLTGWQRFDHFAVVCELLPASMPSLAVNLISVTHGYFNATIHNEIYESMSCMKSTQYDTDIDLDADPYLWEKFSWCFFPGSLVFKVTSRLDAANRDIAAYIERVSHSRAWITEYNRRHNFSAPNRVDEDLEELPSRLHTVNLLLKTAKEALEEWFDVYTVAEWIELHIWPLVNQLETLQREAESMKLRKIWPARPFPILKELAKFGLTEEPPKKRK